MFSPQAKRQNTGKTLRYLAPYQFFNFKRALCVTVTSGCLAIAPIGTSHRVMAQVANPANEDAFETMASTARFLTQSTFGPKPDEVVALTGSSPSQWLLAEFAKSPSLNTPIIETYLSQPDDEVLCEDDEEEDPEDDEEDGEENENEEGEDLEDDEEGDEGDDGDEEESECQVEDEEEINFLATISPGFAFWTNAISGSDQVRQRMAFALSQIMVVSNTGGEVLTDIPQAMGYYQDILTTHALGNYRDLLEAVTYSPAMAYYLTYLANRKGDPTTGRVPDENYAREIMQLFTIGLVELNMDGTPVLDGNGDPIETYTNADITGLAKVFTGLATQCADFDDGSLCEEEDDYVPEQAFAQRMQAFTQFHSNLEKSFLGNTIPAGTGPETSVNMALDILFNHPNVPPFISRQLIQRFVTSNPSPAYVERVATAFAAGSYTLPDGSVVGDARRGDLQATLAAILFDDDARSQLYETDDTFGKIREPVIRFTNWARAYNVNSVTPQHQVLLWNTSSPSLLGQQPYGAPSVFNFYRPGYVAPGTLTAAAGLTVPELQIVNAATTPGYINFMTAFISEGAQNRAENNITAILTDEGIPFDIEAVKVSFRPNYDFEFDLATDATALVDRIEAVMTYITLSPETKAGIVDAVEAITIDSVESQAFSVHLAILLVMTSPDYLVQR